MYSTLLLVSSSASELYRINILQGFYSYTFFLIVWLGFIFQSFSMKQCSNEILEICINRGAYRNVLVECSDAQQKLSSCSYELMLLNSVFIEMLNIGSLFWPRDDRSIFRRNMFIVARGNRCIPRVNCNELCLISISASFYGKVMLVSICCFQHTARSSQRCADENLLEKLPSSYVLTCFQKMDGLFLVLELEA